MIILLYFFLFILGILLQYAIAKQFESVAADKGYADSKYFHFCFWLGMIGYLLVIALPDRGNPTNTACMPTEPVRTVPEAQEAATSPLSPQKEVPCWRPVLQSRAIAVGETNMRCENCSRVQFRGNKSCNQCGARFTGIIG